MSVFSISLDAIYTSPIGTDATFSAFTPGDRVIDKTAGVEVQPVAGGTKVPTIVVACMVRRAKLIERGVTNLATLVNSTVTFNGATWIIHNYSFAPQPGGELEGEARLHLRKQP